MTDAVVSVLTEFCNTPGRAMCVAKMRMNFGSYIAFVTQEGFMSSMTDDATGKYGDHPKLVRGLLSTDWYPVGYGDTAEEAITALTERIATYMGTDNEQMWCDLYNMLVARSYRFDNHRQNYFLRSEFYADKFPEWLWAFSTVTDELIDNMVTIIDKEKG